MTKGRWQPNQFYGVVNKQHNANGRLLVTFPSNTFVPTWNSYRVRLRSTEVQWKVSNLQPLKLRYLLL